MPYPGAPPSMGGPGYGQQQPPQQGYQQGGESISLEGKKPDAGAWEADDSPRRNSQGTAASPEGTAASLSRVSQREKLRMLAVDELTRAHARRSRTQVTASRRTNRAEEEGPAVTSR